MRAGEQIGKFIWYESWINWGMCKYSRGKSGQRKVNLREKRFRRSSGQWGLFMGEVSQIKMVALLVVHWGEGENGMVGR